MIFITTALAALTLVFIVWLIYLKQGNPGIIDVAWAVGIMLVSSLFITANGFTPLKAVYFCLIVVWGLRLAGFLFFTRVAIGERDSRYEALSERWQTKAWGFLINYVFQAFLFWSFSLSFWSLGQAQLTHIGLIETLLVPAALIALFFETLADNQLHQFKKGNKGKVCNVGLWRFSRHPNYFFEWLFWLILALGVFANTTHPLSFAAPIVLYAIMHIFTIPMTEASSLKSRGEAFAAYKALTNCFFPGPPKQS